MKFSGHESFYCKIFWLKKGYDFLKEGKNFNDENAVIDLGVGKNMVSSIKFWLRAFDLINEDNTLNLFADKIFSDNGKDPYLENINTLWLLHYNLIISEYASIYSIIFNEFRKERNEFKKYNLHKFIITKCEIENYSYNVNTINTDISVFLRSYLKPERSSNIEDEFNNLFLDLELLISKRNPKQKLDTLYSFNYKSRSDFSPELILYILLEKYSNNNTIDFNDLLHEKNNIGSVFCLAKNNLIEIIKNLSKKYPFLIFNDDAGIQQIQLKGQLPDKWDIFEKIYN